MTTPSALSKVAAQHFPGAQPPLLFEEGNTYLLTADWSIFCKLPPHEMALERGFDIVAACAGVKWRPDLYLERVSGSGAARNQFE